MPSAMCFRRAATLPTSLKRMMGDPGASPSIPIPGHVSTDIYKRCAHANKLTGRVVSSVLETGETVAKHLTDVLAVLLDEEGAVSENSCPSERNEAGTYHTWLFRW
jgi:hypothetical protein